MAGVFDVIGNTLEGLGAGLGAALPDLTRYFVSQQQAKQQAKLMKQLTGGGYGGLPTLGLGYGATPVQGTGAGSIFGGAMTQPSDPFGLGGTVVGSMLGYANPAAGGCPSLFSRPTAGPHARPMSLVAVPNPDTGRLHWFRHVGQPILFSGDVSHCKRVNKVLSRAARKAGRRSPR